MRVRWNSRQTAGVAKATGGETASGGIDRGDVTQTSEFSPGEGMLFYGSKDLHAVSVTECDARPRTRVYLVRDAPRKVLASSKIPWVSMRCFA